MDLDWGTSTEIYSSNNSRVYKVQQSDGMTVVVKCLSYNPSNSQEFQKIYREIEFLAFLQHPNVVKFLGFSHDEKQGLCYIYMEEGIPLSDYIKEKKQLTFDEIRDFSFDILKGIEFLHSQKVLHRDIKSKNIILVNGVAKLVDFGLSTYLPHGNHCELKDTRGTIPFMAPEVIRAMGHNYSSDIFSFGATLYHMITGIEGIWQGVFPSREPHQMLYGGGTCQYIHLDLKGVPEVLLTVLYSCLHTTSTDRPDATTLLRHFSASMSSMSCSFFKDTPMDETDAIYPEAAHTDALSTNETCPVADSTDTTQADILSTNETYPMASFFQNS